MTGISLWNLGAHRPQFTLLLEFFLLCLSVGPRHLPGRLAWVETGCMGSRAFAAGLTTGSVDQKASLSWQRAKSLSTSCSPFCCIVEAARTSIQVLDSNREQTPFCLSVCNLSQCFLQHSYSIIRQRTHQSLPPRVTVKRREMCSEIRHTKTKHWKMYSHHYFPSMVVWDPAYQDRQSCDDAGPRPRCSLCHHILSVPVSHAPSSSPFPFAVVFKLWVFFISMSWN